MGIAIAVMCHKGGAGKTTTVNSLAGYYSKIGKKVLIIDADEQANVKTLFGLRLSASDGGLASILSKDLMAPSLIQKTSFENIEVILSGGRYMKEFEEMAFQRPDFFNLMKVRCQSLKDLFDIILIDTPPAIGAISTNVVAFTDYVLLVSEPDLLGSLGIRATLQFINHYVGDQLKIKTPIILGSVFTRFDGRRSADHQAFDEMDNYANQGGLSGGKIYEPIRQDSKIRTAQSRRRTIFHYAPNCNAAKDYEQLGSAILKDIDKVQKSTLLINESNPNEALL